MAGRDAVLEEVHKAEPLTLPASWIPDCQGKWDYDSNPLSFTARTYPPRYQDNGKWSALVRVRLLGGPVPGCDKAGWEVDHYSEDRELSQRDFEADTEAALRADIEKWANDEWAQLQAVLRAYYAARPT